MKNQHHSNRFAVTEPMELLTFLLQAMPTKGRNKVKDLLTRKQVSVDDQVVTQYNHVLTSGQSVLIGSSPRRPDELLYGLRILFEDDDLIVIDKESGLLTIASATEKERTAYHQLVEHVRRENPQNRIFIVHRLDRDTSGVMMFAKSERVQQSLQTAWKEMVTERLYVAFVEGRVRQSTGNIVSWLKETSTLMVYSSKTPNGGQKAVTHYQVIEHADEFTLLEVRLETGRKNQIRVHLQDIGHSVVGDKKYGATKNPIGRLGLHAKVLAFQHPTTGKSVRFEAEVPHSFLKLFR